MDVIGVMFEYVVLMAHIRVFGLCAGYWWDNNLQQHLAFINWIYTYIYIYNDYLHKSYVYIHMYMCIYIYIIKNRQTDSSSLAGSCLELWVPNSIDVLALTLIIVHYAPLGFPSHTYSYRSICNVLFVTSNKPIWWE